LAVAVLALVISLAAVLGRDEDHNQAIAGIAAAPGEPPLAGGKEVSLDEARILFEVPIYRPSLPLASDETLRDIWIQTGGSPQLYVRYKSGVILKIRPADGVPSTEEWSEALTGDGVDGATELLGGVDAFVVNPHFPSLGSVRFFFRGEVITLIGDSESFTTDQLRALAISTMDRADAVEAQESLAG
jgi:hypothetical protein